MRARLLFECGRLCESVLSRPEEAIGHYRKALVDNPSHVPSIRSLRRLLLSKGEYGVAVPLFDAQIAATRSPMSRAALLAEKGRLLEDRLGQKRESREAFAAALELNPGDATLLKAVVRAEIGARAWDALDKTVEQSIAAVKSDSRHRAALLVERARIAESRRKNQAQAAELYQAALDADPRSDSAVHALKRLHYSHQRWRDLVGSRARGRAGHRSDARAMALYGWGGSRSTSWQPGAGLSPRGRSASSKRSLDLEALMRPTRPRRITPRSPTGCHGSWALAQRRRTHRVSVRGAQIFEISWARQNRRRWYEKALSFDSRPRPGAGALSRLYGALRAGRAAPICAGEAEAARDPHRRAYATRGWQKFWRKSSANRSWRCRTMRAPSASFWLLRVVSADAAVLDGQRYAELVELYERQSTWLTTPKPNHHLFKSAACTKTRWPTRTRRSPPTGVS